MKRSIILLLLIISTKLYAQHEWAPIGAKWYYDKPEGMMSAAVGYVLIQSVKDTIIYAKNVRVLTVDYYEPKGTIIKYPNIYTYFESGRVYYWDNNQFLLLYNFKATNDTVWQINNTRDQNNCGVKTSGSVIVDSVRQEKIDQVTLKCLYVSPYQSSIWEFRKIIEPVGSTFYILPTPIFCGVADDFPFAAPLRCYEDPALGIVHFDFFTKCDYITTSNKKTNKNKINVFPNPFTSYISINFEPKPKNRLRLFIYNIFGTCVYINDKLELSKSINLQFLVNGIYFVKIYENNNVIFSDKISKYE